MDSDHHRRKRSPILSRRKLLLPCLSFFAFLVFVSPDCSFPLPPVPSSSLPSSFSTSRSLLQRLGRPDRSIRPPRLLVRDRVLFPDHVLLLVDSLLCPSHLLDCVYSGLTFSNSSEDERRRDLVLVEAALSVDGYGETGSVVRCPLPTPNSSFSPAADLRWRGGRDQDGRPSGVADAVLHNWEKLVYEAVVDGDTAVVFVKGLNLRPHRRSDPSPFTCHFGLKGEMTKAVSAAQEVIRCLLPRSVREANPAETLGDRVMIGVSHGSGRRAPVRDLIPSVARLVVSNRYSQERILRRKNRLCACTMVWNQAQFLREWILYHAWLGIERWFIYDNNSDDSTGEVIEELDSRGYNITRHSWPWIKTQEAGFSHCSLRAREECEWVGFFDVDEFFYLPYPTRNHKTLGIPGRGSLKSMVANISSSRKVAEIRTSCHSFGPSGLTARPPLGVTVGYTCRMQQPERHKSIVRTDAVDLSLLNEVHHFRLRDGYRYVNMPESVALVNHYKYQAWETFRSKFFRRVSTYVADWREHQNAGSKDRAPGLGTEAIEPADWRLRFCEVWDTQLRDFVMDNLAEPSTRTLPWQMIPPPPPPPVVVV
ncbi:hypothetical protein MLD38_003234 [Melastoma candidum]|uniref:Uncharacterized protein n=1 Tax=Melastoma candidum TaxID=119954 RepID=A0ACB9S258_9MYRT|nr:hypothetical protein MLD38_003234 [Melastoma candidum]